MRGRPADDAHDAAPDSAEKSLDDQLVEDIGKFELDPYGYVMFAFPWGEKGTELENVTGPRKWQAKLLKKIGVQLRSGAKTTHQAIQEAIASGHGIGKGAFAGMLIMWGLSTHEDTKIVVTANTQTQLATKTMPEVSKWHRLAINSHWFVFTATSLYAADATHSRTWRLDAIPWSEHNTEAFAGLHNEGHRIIVIFDESSAIADVVWEVAEGALTDENTQIIWVALGNSTRNIGRFRECFRKFKHRWGHEQIDSREVEGTNKAQIAKWVADYGEDSDFVKVRVRGMFPLASAKQFFSLADIDAAYGRVIRPENYQHAAKILTVDPAWTGDDDFVIGLRQGLYFRVLRVIPKNDNDVEMANTIAILEDEEKADAVFVDGGFGTGIVSVGRTLGRDWMIVWFAESSADKACFNKRAEMAKLTKLWLKEGGAIEKDPTLHQELAAQEVHPRLDGRLQLASKEEIGMSGNRADTLFLSFAHPVRPKSESGGRGVRQLASERDSFAGVAAA